MTGGPEIIKDKAAAAARVAAWRAGGLKISLVPTMGALHEGHLSLVRLARENADRVLVSIFVNPLQFGAGEDFGRYPRTLERDIELLAAEGAEAIFAPDAVQMYCDGSAARVSVEGSLTSGLCGASRPGHFTGVATVVAKLFNICRPDCAVFGRKDAQQLAVIKRMVDDLDFPIEIIEAPIVREPDGLAMSSRNRYLSPEEREQATVLIRVLMATKELVKGGLADTFELKRRALETMRPATLARPDYIEIVDAETLMPVGKVSERALMALAVFFGNTRLIDNAILAPGDRLAPKER